MKQEGKYKLVTLLGRGSSGEVWTAVDSSEALIAVKIFNDAAFAGKEYEAARAVVHPCILRPFSLDVSGASAAMAMPFCKGRSVDNVAGFFPERMAWTLVRDIASALDGLHAAGLRHGDVKPSNILWDGNSFLLSDFGSCAPFGAALLSRDDSSFKFAAPGEAAGGEGDVWSLGATVFNLVMGCFVFGGTGGRLQLESSPLPYMRKSMPELSALVMRCLSYGPSARPSAGELSSQALEWLETHDREERKRPSAPARRSSDVDVGFWPDEMIDAR